MEGSARRIIIQYIEEGKIDNEFYVTFDLEEATAVMDSIASGKHCFPKHIRKGVKVTDAFMFVGGIVVTDRHVQNGICVQSYISS